MKPILFACVALAACAEEPTEVERRLCNRSEYNVTNLTWVDESYDLEVGDCTPYTVELGRFGNLPTISFWIVADMFPRPAMRLDPADPLNVGRWTHELRIVDYEHRVYTTYAVED